MIHSRLAKIMMLMGRGGDSASPLLTDLLSYWKMDETTGNRVDSHGSNDLSVVGTVGYAVGKLGNAVTCTGSENYLTKAAGINISPTGFTVWGWIRLAVDTRTFLIAGQNGSNIRWYLGYYGSNAWRFYVYDSSLAADSIGIVTQAPTLNAWYFLCGRYNPTTKKAELRLNASAWALGAALGTGPTTDSNNLKIAGNSSSNCNIDSVGIANRYYSDAEVDELYNSGNGLEYPF